jgi:16S rRNA (cytidine1402-2'-O)-methyltransferase
MPLFLVATPLGHSQDISQRAIETLREAEVVIGEERREASKLLKSLGIEGKQLELLNEHSTEGDVVELVAFCREKRVALVTDCGTPGFCDPGARLVAACRAEGLICSPVPGPSSLMCLLSVAGQQLTEFLFRGFLPPDREARTKALRELASERRPFILMDTPYRMTRLLSELSEKFPERRALLGCDFTQETEAVYEAALKDLPRLVGDRKAEFILAVFPTPQSTVRPGALAPDGRRIIQPNPGPSRGRARSR